MLLFQDRQFRYDGFASSGDAAEAITLSAELSANLQESIAHHLELRQQSARLRAECRDAARRLADTIRELRLNRDKRLKTRSATSMPP